MSGSATGRPPTGPVYIVLAVTVDGNRGILGLWAGDGGKVAKYWLQVLTEIKNRGVEDVLLYAALQDGDAISRALKPVYQAGTVAEAEERFLEF